MQVGVGNARSTGRCRFTRGHRGLPGDAVSPTPTVHVDNILADMAEGADVLESDDATTVHGPIALAHARGALWA